jgi:hypothetical protein
MTPDLALANFLRQASIAIMEGEIGPPEYIAWDYEGTSPPYYHVYGDNGVIATWEAAESPERSKLVGLLCDELKGEKP